ncbi:PP2C family serine/threonine-protein phosphatase [Arthrobacter sp. E3]|uniref:PP2C family protein-serine/threonine phosphatase n=1 Tax=Arthrobacter sp. E3 TaxID=517402 RepID=UPI001A942587|nr:PP2C family serine/threonine-protein phosphatase [Arthrobacter sp. E3]
MAEYPLILRYAARSHVGMVRAKNDDSAYAGKYLAVVADGMGGHAGGDVASASTVLDLVHLDHNRHNGDAGTHLADEIQTANSLLSELVHVNPKLAGMGTTVTALLLSGSRLAYAHIGDSRAYRLKDGVFEQMSTDHTFVQRMIDEGRMTEAEAEVHPHKNVLMRVLGDVDASPELDLKHFDASPGERWLLCSDGLNFVRHQMIEEVIRHTKSLATAADTLIDLTLAAGSPDNVSVVIFDIVEANPEHTRTAALDTVQVTPPAAGDSDRQEQHTAPSAASVAQTEHSAGVPLGREPSGDAAVSAGDEDVALGSEDSGSDALDANIREAAVQKVLAARSHELVGAALTANAEGKIPLLPRHPAAQRAATVLTHKTETPAALAEETEESLPRMRHRPLVLSILGVLTALVIVAGSWAAYAWTQTQFFVGVAHGNVTIFKGVSQSLGPISLSHVYHETAVMVSSLPDYSQQLVTATMPASTLSDAEQIISDLQLGTGTSLPPCDLVTTSPSNGPTSSSPPTSTSSAATTAPEPVSSPPVGGSTTKQTAPPTCIPRGGS